MISISLIQCKSCKSKLQANKIKIEDKTIERDIIKRVWYCNECQHEHLIMITDDSIRQIINENKEDNAEISKVNHIAKTLKANELIKKVEELNGKIEYRNMILEIKIGKLENEYQEEM